MEAPVKAILVIAILFIILTFATAWGCAFTGANPPYVPHPVAANYADCRSCHENGKEGAPVPDHIKKDDCVKCHKQQAPGG